MAARAEYLHQQPTAEEVYAEVRREIQPRMRPLARCRSTAELMAHPVYRSMSSAVDRALSTAHIADFRREEAPARRRYRVLAWNIERGSQLEAQLEAFGSHPYLKECDVLLITEADAGMARSRNRMVAETLARELGMAQVFAPCYIALGKGSGVERDVEGDNQFGLHGNALLSRYPIRDVRLVPLANGIDKMAHREKRLGRQTAIAARIEFPDLSIETACVHLDANSTQRHRRLQMRSILESLGSDTPVALGGDWNTSTYDTSHALWAILGFWRRVMMGVDHVIRTHYLHPERWVDRSLFRMLERRGFEYRLSNRLGEYTAYYDVSDPRYFRNLGEWVPEWCFAFIRWALRNHGGRCPMKLDWFATRGLRVENPVVIHDAPFSDHEAIGVDIVP